MVLSVLAYVKKGTARTWLEARIKGLPCTLEVTTSQEQAWKVHEENPFSLVFMDPDLEDSLQLTERLARKTGAQKPWLVLLASGETELQTKWTALASDLINPDAPDSMRNLRLEACVRTSRELDRLIKTAGAHRIMEKAVETMQLGVTLVDEMGVIQYVNPAGAGFHGYQTDDLIGQPVQKLAPKKLWKPLKKKDLSQLGHWVRDSENIDRDGKKFPVRLWSDVVVNEAGHPTGVITISENLSERRAMERQLRESEDKHRAILDSIHEGYLEVNPRGAIVFLNQALLKMLGFEMGDMLGQPYRDFMNPSAHPFSKETPEESGQRLQDWDMRRSDGSTGFAQVSISAMRDSSDNLQGFRCVIRDLTQLRRAQLAQQLREERLAEARGANDGLWDCDMDSKSMAFSRQWSAMLGLKPGEVGDKLEDWLKRIHPEDQEDLRNAITAHLAGASAQIEHQHRILCADGTFLWVLCRGLALTEPDGQIHHMAGSMIDISQAKRIEEELRLSEERFALASRGANDGLWDWDLINKNLYLSPRWMAITGADEEQSGSHDPEFWYDQVHPDDLERLRWDIASHLLGSTPHLENEHRIRHIRGGYRWVLSRGLVVRNKEGIAVRMAGSITDITRRKETEQQLLDLATHDPLTDLFNRRFFMDQFSASLRSSKRYGYPLSLCLVDLDKFKEINDQFGHQMGDEVLETFGRVLVNQLRTSDLACRYGGDEFCLLFPHTTAGGAVKAVDRIMDELKGLTFRADDGTTFKLEATFGVADLASREQTLKQLLAASDAALYEAKQAGRNCIVIHPCTDEWWQETAAAAADPGNEFNEDEWISQGAIAGLWEWDLETELVTYSEGWQTLVGTQEEVLPTSPNEWLARLHPEDRLAAEDAVEKLRSGGESRWEMEIRLQHHSGAWLPVRCRIMAVRGKTGVINRLVGTLFDLTHLRSEQISEGGDYHDNPGSGLLDQAMFSQRLESECNSSTRYSQALTVCMCGLSPSSLILDDPAGTLKEELLHRFSHLLLGTLRSQDFACQITDREYSLAFHHTNLAQAQQAMLRLRDRLEVMVRTWEQAKGTKLHLGLVQFDSLNHNPEGLLERASNALQQARNRDIPIITLD